MAEPSDLRNLLAETVDASETAIEPPQSEAPEKPEKSETGERPRGPDGKFLPKDETQIEETEEEPLEEGEPEVPEEPEVPKFTEPKVDVPAHWSPSDKEMVAKLPAEHRQAVIDRYKAIEAGYTPKLMRAAELEKQFGPAEEIFKPYAEMLRQSNRTPADYIRAWYSAERTLLEGMQEAQQGRQNQRGAQLVARLIQQYHVDPGVVATFLQGQQPAQPNGAAAPAIPPELLQKISSLEEWKANTERSTQAERLSLAERQIETFSQEKDAAGNLAHPYFSEVEQDMMDLARLDQAQGRSIDLAALYDRAVHANPSTRAKLLEARDAQARQKAVADRKAKAAAAQRASSSVTGSPVTGQSPNEERGKPKSLRDTIMEAEAETEAA